MRVAATPLRKLAGLALVALSPAAAAQDRAIDWVDGKELTVEGQAFRNLAAPWDRLPKRAEGLVRDPVWGLSRDSAGIALRFSTDATTIHARWKLTRERLAMPHMPASGVSGLDLYARGPDGRWRWVAATRPDKQEMRAVLIDGILAAKREYMLYLPLYNGVSAIQVGVPTGSILEPGRPRDIQRSKPVVFYGTSITHGASASRPGMTHVAILGRRLDRPVVNLGFSGNGTLDASMAEMLGAIDAAAYVVDCLPNLNGDQVSQRIGPFVRKLRELQPDTPIVMVEDRSYQDAWLRGSKKARNDKSRKALREGMDLLRQAGFLGLYYVFGEGLLGNDGEGTVDSSHPNDLGFMRQADAIQPTLRRALDAAKPQR